METVRQSVREFRAMTKRVSISTTIALWVCLGMTILMFAISMFIPPKGIIDPSIFKAAGFLFAFASLFELREAHPRRHGDRGARPGRETFRH